MAEQVVNASYERQRKIEQKRATENAIQKVANIAQGQSSNANEKAESELKRLEDV